MTTTWVALAIGLALLPVTTRAAQRAHGLAELGRVSHSRSGMAARAWSWRAVLLGVAVVGIGSVALTRGMTLAAAAAVVLATGAYVIDSALRGKAVHRADADLLAAVRAMVAEVEAGGSSAAAFDAAGQVFPGRGEVFAAAAAACRRGELPQLTDDAAARSDGTGPTAASPRSDVELAALEHCWRVAADTGAPVAGVLSRLAEHLAARIDQHRSVAAALSGPRSSAALLAGLPLLGLALGAAMQADPVGVLVGTPSGRLLCLVGVILDAAGVLWTQRLTARAARG